MINPQPNGNGKKTEHRLTKLETQLETILTNHLPHIQEGIDKLGVSIDKKIISFDEKIKSVNTKFWALITLLIANLLGLIFALLKNLF